MFLLVGEAAVQAIASKVGAAARAEAMEADSEAACAAVAVGGAVPCVAAVRALKDAKMHKAEVA